MVKTGLILSTDYSQSVILLLFFYELLLPPRTKWSPQNTATKLHHTNYYTTRVLVFLMSTKASKLTDFYYFYFTFKLPKSKF